MSQPRAVWDQEWSGGGVRLTCSRDELGVGQAATAKVGVSVDVNVLGLANDADGRALGERAGRVRDGHRERDGRGREKGEDGDGPHSGLACGEKLWLYKGCKVEQEVGNGWMTSEEGMQANKS